MDDISDEPALCGVARPCAAVGSNGVYNLGALIFAILSR